MKHVAVDIGANGGTVHAGEIEVDRMEITEVYRFDNRPVEWNDRYVWDVDELLSGIEVGLSKADASLGGIDTVGIDTWGLDFGLVRDGELMQHPYSYRDPAVSTTREEVVSAVGKQSLFEMTGLNHWNTPNTLWQYHALAATEPGLLADADHLLMMPQLLSYLLGGEAVGEVTIASTTQMLDPHQRSWTTSLIEQLSLPTEPLPSLREPGTRIGTISAVPLSSEPELVLPASHDTAAAVAGMPLSDDSAFLSTGSWFILGVVSEQPVRSQTAYEADVSNELGFDDTVRLLRNINGFFLLEECREVWRRENGTTAYDDLLEAARVAPDRASLVDPDADVFSINADTPVLIETYCRDTDQRVPKTEGEIVRCLLDSLVAKTAVTLDELTAVVDRQPSILHVGGGGVRNELFCQLLADATGQTVRTGPAEATAIGNLLTQAVTAETLPDLFTGHRLVESASDIRTYEPTNTDGWNDAKAAVKALPTETE